MGSKSPALGGSRAAPWPSFLMDWDAPAIVLDARPTAKADAVATLMTEEHGAHRGPRARRRSRAPSVALAARQPGAGPLGRPPVRPARQLHRRAGASRRRAAMRTTARARHADRRLRGCRGRVARARAASARVRRPAAPAGPPAAGRGLRWPTWSAGKLLLLADLGYGLDLSRCAVTGATEGLAYVSPKPAARCPTTAPATWEERLLRLPASWRSTPPPSGPAVAGRPAPHRAFPRPRRLRAAAPPLPAGPPGALRLGLEHGGGSRRQTQCRTTSPARSTTPS